MIKRSKEYWQERFLAVESGQNKLAEQTQHEIDYLFDKAQHEIDNTIRVWYQRFAENNEISMADARKWLNKDELEEFKWTVEEYIKHGKMGEAFKKQLENASSRFHIRRLEALKIQSQTAIESLYSQQHDKMSALLGDVYKDSYYKTLFEVQRGFGVGFNVSGINEAQLHKILKTPWTTDAKTFSDRIWQDKTKLVNELHNQLFRNILTGASPAASIDFIHKKFNTSKYNASRVVMTESAHFAVQAQKDTYEYLEVEKYEVLETLDSITCDECGEMDGKVFDTKDLQSGVTAPPFHPFCRGTTIPAFDDDFGERIARDDEGNTYYVPSDMTYNEWEEKQFTNEEKSGIISKNIGLEISKGAKASIPENVINKIQSTFDSVSERYNIVPPKIFTSGTLPDNTPFQWHYENEHRIIVNKNFGFSETEVLASYEKKHTTSKNLENLIQHELAHVLTFQNMTSKRMSSFDSELREEAFSLPFISEYARKDGAEYIAEAFVKRCNNEQLPNQTKEFLNKYIDKWRISK